MSDTYNRNQQVIARSGGSQQARHNHNDCPICEPEALTCPNCGEVTKTGEYCASCQADEDREYADER